MGQRQATSHQGTHSTCCRRLPRRRSLTAFTSANSSLKERNKRSQNWWGVELYIHAFYAALFAVWAWSLLHAILSMGHGKVFQVTSNSIFRMRIWFKLLLRNRPSHAASSTGRELLSWRLGLTCSTSGVWNTSRGRASWSRWRGSWWHLGARCVLVDGWREERWYQGR